MRKIRLLNIVLTVVICLVSSGIPAAASVKVPETRAVSPPPAVIAGEAALAFSPGSRSVVNCGDDAGLNPIIALTLEAWVKTAGSETNQGVIARKSWNEWTENRGYSVVVYGTSHPLYAGHVMAKVGNGESITRERVDDNVWHYIAVTWANGGVISVYIDGKEATYERQDAVTGPIASYSSFRIGQYYSDWSFNGTIDEVRVSGVVRSDTIIAGNWNGGKGRPLIADSSTAGLWHLDEGAGNTASDSTGRNSGTIYAAAWTSGFPFPGVNHPPFLASVGNRSVQEGQTLAFTVGAMDADGDPLVFSASGLPSGAAFDNGTHIFNWTPAAGQAGAYPDVTFTVSDGQSSVSESITIKVTPANAAAGMALVFNPVDGSVVNCGGGTGLDPATAITVEAWIKTPGGVTNQGVIAKKSVNEWTENAGYSLVVYGSSHPSYAGHVMAKVGNGESITRERVNDNTWHYIAMTWTDGQPVRVYIDGKEATYEWQNVVTGAAASASKFRIGQYYSDWSFNGAIDEVRVSNVARSGGEISANWNGGTGKRLKPDDGTAGLWHLDEEPQEGEPDLHNYEAIIGNERNPLIPTGDWDEQIRELGNVLYEPLDTGKQYKITYCGFAGAYTENNVYVGYAYSADGINWVKHGRLIDRSLEDPYVVKSGDLYYLFAEDKAGGGKEIRKYHSTDFLNWTDDGVVLSPTGRGFESYIVASPIVWIENATWYMIYEGINGEVSLGLVTSTDGVNWVRDANNPIMRVRPGKWDDREVVSDDIVKVDGTYYMTYHGHGTTGGFWAGKAESTDLHNWTRYDSPITRKTDTMMFAHDGTYHIYAQLDSEDGIGLFEPGFAPLLSRDETANLNHGTPTDVAWTEGVPLTP